MLYHEQEGYGGLSETAFQKIYRYFDKLYNTRPGLVQEISDKHAKGLFSRNFGILFYDVTTLYFETTNNDELRNPSFSMMVKMQIHKLFWGLLSVVEDILCRILCLTVHNMRDI